MSFMEELRKEREVKAWETTAATCFVYYGFVIKCYVHVEPPSSQICEYLILYVHKQYNNNAVCQTHYVCAWWGSIQVSELIMMDILPLSGVQRDGPRMLHISS